VSTRQRRSHTRKGVQSIDYAGAQKKSHKRARVWYKISFFFLLRIRFRYSDLLVCVIIIIIIIVIIAFCIFS
jgi:hypothetical protein